MKRLLPALAILIAFIFGFGLRIDAQSGAIGFSLIVQNGGTAKGAVVGINCDGTTVTCAAPSGGFTKLSAVSGAAGINQLTGDVTAGPGAGSQVATLATVLGSPGSCGDATHSCGITANGKGLITALSNTAISGVGTSTITAGTVASLPGSVTNGNEYLATDAPLVYFGISGVWTPFVPGISPGQTVLPQGTGWSFTNQGSATVDTTRGGIFLSAPASASNSIHAYMRTAITPPWTVDTGAYQDMISTAANPELGLVMYESGTGKFIEWIFQGGTQNLSVIAGTALSSGGVTSRSSTAINQGPGGWRWLQFTYDSVGHNVIFRTSGDGRLWIQIYSQAVTTDFTTAPDTYGILVNPRNANLNSAQWLLYWNERSGTS